MVTFEAELESLVPIKGTEGVSIQFELALNFFNPETSFFLLYREYATN